MDTQFDIDRLDFGKSPDGLLPAVAHDHHSGQIRMLAFVNREAVEQSMQTGFAHFYSRSKGRLWQKGEESGNTLRIVGIATDCDADAIIYAVKPQGPTCHTGAESCFFAGDTVTPQLAILQQLEAIITQRREQQPQGSYVAQLFASGLDRIAQKVGEEGIETVIAAKNDDREDFVNESADLLFHLLVLLQARGCSLEDVLTVLRQRHR